MDDQQFRQEVRAWLSAHFPSALAGVNPLIFQGDARAAAASTDFQTWRQAMADKGWGTPTWAKRYGGAELPEAQAQIIAQELAAIGAFNPIRSYGTMMLGPTLLEFGTEEQRLEHLPKISRHELRWCQGFSEPGAGSDLASLQMKCVDKGDHWLVSGQKIWTSGADQAGWCFALVRTDTSVKHNGISFLLIDMASPGVEARPIVLISGSTHFCEVFFNDVKVPKGNLVGQLNKGWTIAKRLLQFERASLSEVKTDVVPLAPIAHAMLGTDPEGRIADPLLRGRILHNAMRHAAYLQTVRRLSEEARHGGPNNGVSTLKNLWSGIVQRRAELMIEVQGFDGLGWSGEGYSKDGLEATRALLHSKAFSIYGGSYEIQNNITAKRSLGLPDR
ncbi:acyl-CoA dehydrogenase family protein [Novosphingobium rosa]|uniref:acyl-CoA dehydrogenase family protein n=1 Tax=Novosphingobium rosa TaxID=76978 RepID=UPI00082B3808|nr:acyl-CoA dehydrogenase family protein [Novosphingobium rosa]